MRPIPVREEIDFQGHKIRSYHFRTNSNKPPILFFHATGYSALTYQTLFDEWIQAGYSVHSIDFLSHGESSKSDDFSNWWPFRNQVLALKQKLSQESSMPPVLVGHSLGGANSLLAAAKDSNLTGVVALDPVVLGPLTSYLTLFVKTPLATIAANRRTTFKNLDIVRRSYRKSPAFKNFDDQVFKDYLTSCFVRNQDDSYSLALPREIEAKLFRTLTPGHWWQYRKIKVPVFAYITQNSDVCPLKSAKRLAGKNKHSIYKVHESGSHFFPMEDPKNVATDVLNFIDSIT